MVSGPCQLPANDTATVAGAVCGPLQPAAPTTPVQSVKTTMPSVAWRIVMWVDSDGDYMPERRRSDRTGSASRAARRRVRQSHPLLIRALLDLCERFSTRARPARIVGCPSRPQCRGHAVRALWRLLTW